MSAELVAEALADPERRYSRMHRVRTRKAGALEWHTTRYFVMGHYAQRYAEKMRGRGYEVQFARAALGPWQVMP